MVWTREFEEIGGEGEGRECADAEQRGSGKSWERGWEDGG